MKNVVMVSVVLGLCGCSSAPSPAATAGAQASNTAEGEACAHHGEGHAEGEACAHHGAGHAEGEHSCDHDAPGGPAAASITQADGSVLYGQALNASIAVTPLATVLAAPANFAGQTIRTEGEVAAVCQRMGCWMELRAEGGTVRVPIAGHAFNLPRDITGKHASIEGTVNVTELSEAQRAHLASEGAQALGSSVSIAATGVQLR